MNYNEIKGSHDVCAVDEEILDEDLIQKYQKLLDAGKPLPKGVAYEEEDEIGVRFYKIYSDDEIEAQLEVSRTKSLDSIATTLNFFKWLAIISIIAIIVIAIVFTLKFSSLIDMMKDLGRTI